MQLIVCFVMSGVCGCYSSDRRRLDCQRAINPRLISISYYRATSVVVPPTPLSAYLYYIHIYKSCRETP